MECNKRDYAIKNSISHLESVLGVAVVRGVYATFLNDPGTQGENTLSPTAFQSAVVQLQLQKVTCTYTGTNSNTILVEDPGGDLSS